MQIPLDEVHGHAGVQQQRAARESRNTEGNNVFTFAVYAQLCRRPGNLLLSPFSIRAALALAYAGARGATAAQMEKALRLAPDGRTHEDVAQLTRRVAAPIGGGYELLFANSLWLQEGTVIRRDFLDRIESSNDASLHRVDFVNASGAAREAINAWVEEKTKHTVRGVIGPGTVDATTRLLALNAVYFNGTWVNPFPPSRTRPKPFYVEGGREVTVPLMHRKQHVLHMHAEGWYQAVELHYRGGDLTMLVLLPDGSPPERPGKCIVDAYARRLPGTHAGERGGALPAAIRDESRSHRLA